MGARNSNECVRAHDGILRSKEEEEEEKNTLIHDVPN